MRSKTKATQINVIQDKAGERDRIQAHVYIKQFYELNHISLTSGNKNQVVADRWVLFILLDFIIIRLIGWEASSIDIVKRYIEKFCVNYGKEEEEEQTKKLKIKWIKGENKPNEKISSNRSWTKTRIIELIEIFLTNRLTGSQLRLTTTKEIVLMKSQNERSFFNANHTYTQLRTKSYVQNWKWICRSLVYLFLDLIMTTDRKWNDKKNQPKRKTKRRITFLFY